MYITVKLLPLSLSPTLWPPLSLFSFLLFFSIYPSSLFLLFLSLLPNVTSLTYQVILFFFRLNHTYPVLLPQTGSSLVPPPGYCLSGCFSLFLDYLLYTLYI